MATFLFNDQNYATMKNTYKISAILLVSLIIGITSCKKDEQIIEGCTDSSAMNYLSNATSNNGSCIYAYEIAKGTWNINPDCEEIDILGQIISLNDQLPESIDVQGTEEHTLFIDIAGAQVSGTIDNSGSITVAEQTASIDIGLGIPIPVQVSGTGKIESENSGYMDLTYSGEIDIIPNLPIPLPFSTTCHIILSK